MMPLEQVVAEIEAMPADDDLAGVSTGVIRRIVADWRSLTAENARLMEELAEARRACAEERAHSAIL